MKYLPTHKQGSSVGVQVRAASAEQLQITRTVTANSTPPFMVKKIAEQYSSKLLSSAAFCTQVTAVVEYI